MLKQSISEYAEYLQAEKAKAAGTRSNYLQAVRQFYKVCSTHPRRLYLPDPWEWADVDKRALEIYLNHLREERRWKPATLTQQASALRHFFSFLQERGRIGRNPARSLLPKAPPPGGPPPEGDEAAVRALFRIKPTTLDKARRLLLMELFYGAAMRSGQVYAIGSMRINRRKNLCTMQIVSGDRERGNAVTPGPDGAVAKGAETREVQVVLSPDGLDRAKAYLEMRKRVLADKPKARRGSAFWVDAHGKPMARAAMSREVGAALERVGLDGGPGLLRQLSARHFRERGADSRAVMNLLGVKRLGRLDRYGAPPPRRLLEQFRSAHPRNDSD